jgi:hypothetical protein
MSAIPQDTTVIAGLVPATPITWHGRALMIGVAGTSLDKPGHDHSLWARHLPRC